MNTLHRWAHFFSYQIQIWTSNTFFWVRASVADMLNVLNAIIFGIWHTKQQKWSFIRCVKCIKLLQHVTVPLHFWHGTDNNGIWVYYFFIHLSLSSHFFIWFFLSFLRICLSLPTRVLPLLTIGCEQEEGSNGGQERRKGSHDFVEINGGGGVRFRERSEEVSEWGWGTFDFWSLSLGWN